MICMRQIVSVLSLVAGILLGGLFLATRPTIPPPRTPIEIPGPVDPSADVIFLGDSITAGWAREGAAEWPRFGRAQNLGANSSQVQDVHRAIGALAGASPEVLVIAVGTNDLPGSADPSDVADEIAAVVHEAHRVLPETEIVLVGILPRARQRYDVEGRAVNAIIRDADLPATFVEVQIPVTPDVMPDSLHLSPLGYRLVADQIVPHIRPVSVTTR